MRILAILLALALPATTSAHDTGTPHPENRTGLKSNEVIRNDLQLQGLDVGDVSLDGPNATIDARMNGRDLRLRVDRITGAITPLSGPLFAPPELLARGLIHPGPIRIDPGRNLIPVEPLRDLDLRQPRP